MEFLEAVARMAAAITAVAAALSVLLHRKSPVGKVFRWFARRNIVEPFSSWMRRQVHVAVAPDVDRLDARITELSERNDHQHAENAEHIREIRELLARSPEARTRADDPEVTQHE